MTTKLRPLALLFAALALLAPGLAGAQEPTVRDLPKSEEAAPSGAGEPSGAGVGDES